MTAGALAVDGGGNGSLFHFFMPLAKVEKQNDGSCIVSGYASTPTKDMDGEIVTLDAVKTALPGYMEWRNIREMHRLSAVGTAQEAHVDDQGLFVRAKIVGKDAVQKCLEKVYKGFSIGGRKLAKVANKITEIDLVEISLVDRPNNPDCRISLVKRAKDVISGVDGYLLKATQASPQSRAIRKMAKVVDLLAKANTNPSPKDDDQQNNKAADDADLDKGGDAPGDGSKPYGNVEYADPGYQADKKKRYPLDTKKHVKAALGYINQESNGKKYSPENLAKIKAKINAAAKKLGIGKKKVAKIIKAAQVKDIDEESVANAHHDTMMRKASAVMELRPTDQTPDPFVLHKSMGTVGSLSYCFDSLRNAQRSLLIEAKREGGDMKDKNLAKRLGDLAQGLAEVIGQKAEHEGSEAQTLTDADDQYVLTTLGEDFQMAAKPNGDDLTNVLMKMFRNGTLQKNAKPNDDDDDDDDARDGNGPRKLTGKMRKNMKMAKKSQKDCAAAIEKAHKLLKDGYVAKAEMVKAGKASADDGFNFVETMAMLQKAYTAIDTIGTCEKAVRADLKKMASGLGPADGGLDRFGAKNLNIDDLKHASPGGDGRSSDPPENMSDRVFPGKAATADGDNALMKFADKNGMVPVAIAEMLSKNATLEGEVNALRNMPRGGARPMTFDLRKIGNGSFADGEQRNDVQKALFDGVDTTALMSGDETQRAAAAARVAGNFLLSGKFGKSIIDPSFRGAAGAGRSNAG